MNKKILMSVAAAATLATTFTGCGSDSSTSTNATTGTATKAELNGATVTIGTATATTDSSGRFTVNRPAGSTATAVTITGGSYTLNGVAKTNNVTLKATTAQLNAGAPVSMLTTLTSDFDGNVTAAANALGITLPAGLDVTSTSAIAAAMANIDAGDFEANAAALALTLEKVPAANLGTFISAIKSNSTTKKDIATLTSELKTAATNAGATDVNNTLTAIGAGQALGYALKIASGESNGSDYNASAYAITNAINVDANSTTGNMYSINGTTPSTTLAYSGGAITSSSTSMDANNTLVSFKLTDNNSTLTNANGNTSVFIKLTGLDSANINSAYVMGLTGLDINSTNLTVVANSTTMALGTYANSNVSYSIAADSNATVAADFFDVASGYNVVNVSKFKNYMDSVYTNENSNVSTIGNFTNGMSNGNYSLKVYVNVADQKMSYNNALSNVISSSMAKTTSESTSLFSGVKAYKVLDANLSY